MSNSAANEWCASAGAARAASAATRAAEMTVCRLMESPRIDDVGILPRSLLTAGRPRRIPGLELTVKSHPSEFKPDHSQALAKIRETLSGVADKPVNDLKTAFCKPPYALTQEMVTLYVAALVRSITPVSLQTPHSGAMAYDPNYPNRDDLTLSLSLAAPEQAAPIKHSRDPMPVFAFFRVNYKFRSPPA